MVHARSAAFAREARIRPRQARVRRLGEAHLVGVELFGLLWFRLALFAELALKACGLEILRCLVTQYCGGACALHGHRMLSREDLLFLAPVRSALGPITSLATLTTLATHDGCGEEQLGTQRDREGVTPEIQDGVDRAKHPVAVVGDGHHLQRAIRGWHFHQRRLHIWCCRRAFAWGLTVRRVTDSMLSRGLGE